MRLFQNGGYELEKFGSMLSIVEIVLLTNTKKRFFLFYDLHTISTYRSVSGKSAFGRRNCKKVQFAQAHPGQKLDILHIFSLRCTKQVFLPLVFLIHPYIGSQKRFTAKHVWFGYIKKNLISAYHFLWRRGFFLLMFS